MDLRERKEESSRRHPWEIARLKALENIIKMHLNMQLVNKSLDIGCGDAFLANSLCERLKLKMIDGIDINLSSDQIISFSQKNENVHLYNTYDSLQSYDLIILSDVIEHISDDTTFLKDIAANYLNPQGYILITVPAFQFLYSSHDVFLGHYRRYDLKQLTLLVNQLDINIISSGYFFLTLLPIRFFSLFYEVCFPKKKTSNEGIGNWNSGIILSKFLEYVLISDAHLLLKLSSLNIKLPGLSTWILCQK